jgi:hypothetical protein
MKKIRQSAAQSVFPTLSETQTGAKEIGLCTFDTSSKEFYYSVLELLNYENSKLKSNNFKHIAIHGLAKTFGI